MFGQWGFGKTEQQGLTVLFHGAPGTGKSLAAEAVGYEVGKPLKASNESSVTMCITFYCKGGKLWRIVK